jgi:hypothetical protein
MSSSLNVRDKKIEHAPNMVPVQSEMQSNLL